MIDELFTSPLFLMSVFLIMISGYFISKLGVWLDKLKKHQHSIEYPVVTSFEVAVKRGLFQGEYVNWLRLLGLEDKQALDVYHECSNIYSVKYGRVERIIKATEVLGIISAIILVFSALFGAAQAVNIMSDVSIDDLKKVNEIKSTYEFELRNKQNSREVKNIISNQLSYVEHAIASNDKITSVEYDRIKKQYNAYRLKNFSVEYAKYVESNKSKSEEVTHDK